MLIIIIYNNESDPVLKLSIAPIYTKKNVLIKNVIESLGIFFYAGAANREKKDMQENAVVNA